jgi:hypothetical protein
MSGRATALLNPLALNVIANYREHLAPIALPRKEADEKAIPGSPRPWLPQEKKLFRAALARWSAPWCYHHDGLRK